jgi:hypothetical protein
LQNPDEAKHGRAGARAGLAGKRGRVNRCLFPQTPGLPANADGAGFSPEKRSGTTIPREARAGLMRAWLEILKERHPEVSWIARDPDADR